MATNRKRRLDIQDRACLNCQKRKSKCVPSEDGNTCVYCLKMGKSCVFESPPLRTPLTRKNFDDLESRCQTLEALIQKLQPNVDLQEIAENPTRQDSPIPPRQQPTQVETEATAEQAEDALSNNGFEWRENLEVNSRQNSPSRDDGRDGMASLPARKHGTGYLGDTAGTSILESVSSMLPSSAQENQQNTTTEVMAVQPNLIQHSISSLTGGLNASVLQNHLIDLYFTSYNISYPILHERSFRAQYNTKKQLSANSTWHIIHYMVLAIGEWVGGYCSEDQSVYYEAARSRLRIDILESGALDTVQAFLLLGNYLQKRDRPNTGYNFIGIAYRIALGLGLHREITPSGRIVTFLQQRRRLLFWTLYCFESGFSITTGRPTLVSDSFIDVRKPQNIDDAQCSPNSKLPEEVDYPTGCTAIAAHARLAVIANKIYTDFLSTRGCSNVDHQIAILEQAIQNWRDSLPSYFWDEHVPDWFLGPRQVVLWKELNLRILLLLTGQRHQIDEDDRVALGMRCQNVAVRAIFDIVNFCDTQPGGIHQGISWYAVYFILQASLALCVHQLKERRKSSRRRKVKFKQGQTQQWEVALTRARECLGKLGLTNNAANRTLKILDRLFQNVQHGNAAAANNDQASTSPAQSIPGAGSSTSTHVAPSPQNTQAYPNITRPDFTTQQFAASNPVNNTSPADAIATNFVDNQWIAAIDPSLHMFLDNAQSIDGVFEDLQGFPNTMEQDSFAYMTSSLRTMRGDLSGNEWLDFGPTPSMYQDNHTSH